jgi:hypothetical protein
VETLTVFVNVQNINLLEKSKSKPGRGTQPEVDDFPLPLRVTILPRPGADY